MTFPPSVIEKIGFYVYCLIDPETSQTFYIGKGTGNRVFNHAQAAISKPDPSEKLDRIREIMSKGFKVAHIIQRHGLTEKEAFEVEAALIDYVGMVSLTNQLQGHYSGDRGRMTVDELIEMYAAPEITILEPGILVIINRRFRQGMNDSELYEATLGNWVIGSRREQAKYVFAVSNQIVRAVYEIERWYSADQRVPPQSDTLNRWCFEGKPALELKHYVGGSIARYLSKGSQNPIRYVNC
ncbi:MAG: hypothetical protein J0M33_26530 [Anaerolineae bacterium]|nr:hypothetical protein [Anaerolineae bacterium]